MDPIGYEKNKEDLWNGFLKGQNNYPKRLFMLIRKIKLYNTKKYIQYKNNEGGFSFFN